MTSEPRKFHASHHYPNVLVVCLGTADVFSEWYSRAKTEVAPESESHYGFCPFVYTQQQLLDAEDTEPLNQLYSHEFGVLLTVGGLKDQLAHHLFPEINAYLSERLLHKWMHLSEEELRESSFQNISDRVHNVFLNYVRKRFTPAISVFTTSFHSHEKIFRVFSSLRRQTLQDWEWVIIDDSKDDDNFLFLRREVSAKDYRITVLRRDFHSGCIGLVKNQAAALCHAPFVVEVDHDDELLPDCLEEIRLGFTRFPEVGFVYMTFAECHEGDRKPHEYHSPWALGYGYYRDEEFDGVQYKVGSTPNINDLTVSNIVGMPNHPRAWRKSVLMEVLGNYSEYLPVADDYELLYRTFLLTPMLHIDKFAYIQFRNRGGNNFTFIRNREITKFQARVSALYGNYYQVNARFQDIGVCQRPRFYGAGPEMDAALKAEEFVNFLVTGSVKDLAEEEVLEARRIRKEAQQAEARSEEWRQSWRKRLLIPVGPSSRLIPGIPFPLLPGLAAATAPPLPPSPPTAAPPL